MQSSSVVSLRGLKQWPVEAPSLLGFDSSPLLDEAKAFEIILPEWERVYHNFELSQHVRDVQLLLRSCQAQPLFNRSIVESNDTDAGEKKKPQTSTPTLIELVKQKGPILIQAECNRAERRQFRVLVMAIIVHTDVRRLRSENGSRNLAAELSTHLGVLSLMTLS